MSLPGSVKPYVGQSDEHQRLDWIGNMELAVILDSATTGDQLTIVEIRAERAMPHQSTFTARMMRRCFLSRVA